MAQVYINGDLIRNLLPDISRLKDYLQYANDPDRKSRDVRPLMSVLQRLPQADLWLVGLLQTRKYAVLGYNHTITMPEGMKTPPQEEKRIAEIKARFRKSKIRTTFSTAIMARLFGMSAARLVWKNIEPYGQLVTEIRKYNLTELDKDENSIEGLVKVGEPGIGQMTISALDPDTHIQCYDNPLEDIQQDYVGGVMRTVMFPVLLKYLDLFNWARQNEKWGDPTFWASYKPGTDKTEIDALLTGLAALARDNYGAFSDNVTVKLLEATRTGMTDMHQKFQDAVNKEISIGILGQTLTTDVGSVGSKAAAQVHDFVRKDFLWSDIMRVEQVITEQYVQQDYRLNYGEPADAYPEFHFMTDETPDFESNARVIGELLTSNVALKKSEVYAKTGFTEPGPDDKTISGVPKSPALPVSPSPVGG